MRPAPLNTEPTRTSLRDLTKVFNTALVATRATDLPKNPAQELASLMESAPFRAVLTAASALAAEQGISERDAAEQIIQTFRKIDRIWMGYLYEEGMTSVFKN